MVICAESLIGTKATEGGCSMNTKIPEEKKIISFIQDDVSSYDNYIFKIREKVSKLISPCPPISEGTGASAALNFWAASIWAC